MLLLITDDDRPAAVRLNDPPFRDRVDSVIGTLAMDIGLEQQEQPLNGRIAEDDDIVNAAEGRQDLGAFGGWHEGASRTLQPHDVLIVVHGNDQAVGFGRRTPQIPDVPDVQKIETSVGKGQATACQPILPNDLDQLRFLANSSHGSVSC
jgi:hypothetical protein